MTIVRRAVAGFRRQDWTAVAIELVVVVLGVFLGVQAANWNQDREQDRKSAVSTERLKTDLRAEAWNIEMQVGYHEQVQANARRAADALSGHGPLPDEALWSRPTAPPSTTTTSASARPTTNSLPPASSA